jgi:RNA polymerase sigma-70 factor (ECF subfamily)
MTTRSFDPLLMAQLQQRDQLSWQVFYERYSTPLSAYIRSSVDASIDVEDLVQETMIAAVTALPHYNGRAQMSTWLIAIARHKIADHYRRRKLTCELAPDHPAPFASESSGLWEAFSRLPKEYERALILRHWQGLSVAEVAEQLGRGYKATESLLGRAREALRAALSDE